MDEQCGGAGGRQEQDKVQDCQGAQKRIGAVELVWADATGIERSDGLELSELVTA